MDNIYQFTVKDAAFNDVSLADYRGKVLLVINTATGCGFTPQYDGLQDLYAKYKEAGLEILDFPCNQFLNQAPGSEDEIVEFCTTRYGVDFKIFAKVKVNGKEAAPLFDYLKNETPDGKGRIKWNFTKFLIGRDGKPVKRYGSKTTPEEIEPDLKALLNQEEA